MLGLLADGPRHGYELKSAYEGDLLPSSNVNFGQVYTTLERLSRDGLVEFEQVNQAERRRTIGAVSLSNLSIRQR